MYLKKLYHQHKGWFIVVVLFIVVQLALSIRRDASVTPFFHYGMYSQVMKPEHIYVVPEINVNGKALQTKNFSPQVWDKIEQPIVLFDAQQAWNSSLYHNYIGRLLHVKDSSKYVNHLSETEFQYRYSRYLSSLLQTPVDSLRISFTITAYSNNQLNQRVK